jgi:hypothetical protein
MTAQLKCKHRNQAIVQVYAPTEEPIEDLLGRSAGRSIGLLDLVHLQTKFFPPKFSLEFWKENFCGKKYYFAGWSILDLNIPKNKTQNATVPNSPTLPQHFNIQSYFNCFFSLYYKTLIV